MTRRIRAGVAVVLLLSCNGPDLIERTAPATDELSVTLQQSALHEGGANINISNAAGAQGEPGIAMNPTNPLNLVAVANNIPDLSQLACWFSTDGGLTWTANFLDETEDAFGANDNRFDPNVAFDSDGNVYVVYSTTGSGNRVVVLRSADGGQNFNQATTVTTDGAASNNLHTPMITTRAGDGPDDVLVVWARVQAGGESIEAALSLDAGATFPTTNNNINDTLERTFLPWAVAEANGNFAVVWEVNTGGGAGAIFHDTLDTATLADNATDTQVTTVQITDFDAATSKIPAQPDRGLFSVTTVDVDRTTGRLYLSYSDRANTATNDIDIFVRTSDDNGANWSAATQINDDTGTTSQFMPRMAVDQTTGVVYLAWYDARNDATNNQRVDIFVSSSTDGGVTWSANHQLTTATSNESTTNANRDNNNYTEYFGMTANGGVAHVAWTDARDANFTGGTNEDVFTARLDNNPPVARCRNVTVNANASCQAAASIDDGSFDPDGDAFTCTQAPPGPYTPVNTTVTLTCTDNRNESGSCTGVVTVVDVTPPTLTVPGPITISTCRGANIGVATGTDNCGPVTITNNAPTTFPLGQTVVVWTATDSSGNTTTATQIVTAELGDSDTCCPAGTRVIRGNQFDNNLHGTSGNDCILGLGGNDQLFGNGGNDFLSGGAGNDNHYGGTGNDQIFGGPGVNQLFGEDGNDTLIGGADGEVLIGGNGADTLEGRGGGDNMSGGAGNDVMRGGDGNDVLAGDADTDQLFGDGGNDQLTGGAGNDALNGGAGTDTCTAGGGSDTLTSCNP